MNVPMKIPHAFLVLQPQDQQTLYTSFNINMQNISTRTVVSHGKICLFTSTVCIIHSIGMCRMRQFLAVLRSFFHSSLLCTFSCHPSPPTILPSSLTSSCHIFLGPPLNLVVPKFMYNTLLGILFSSILCTCPNQRNLFNLIVSIIVGYLTRINFFIG